jgi:hypothetical protein
MNKGTVLKRIAVFGFLLVLLGTPANTLLALSWSIDTVDSTASVSGSTGITMRSINSLQQGIISYYDSATRGLKAAKWDPIDGGWGTITIDPLDTSGYFNASAINSYGNARIVYSWRSWLANYNLKYAEFVGSGGNCGFENNWRCQSIDTSSDSRGLYVDLALDSSNTPHISYYDETNKDLRYAKRVGSGGDCGPSNSWKCVMIDGAYGANVGKYTSIAIQAPGTPYISYYDETNQNLKMAKYVGSGGNCGPSGDWSCETVDGGTNDRGKHTSIIYGCDASTSCNPRISYFDDTTNDLLYAFQSSGVWTIETVDGTSSSVGTYNSLGMWGGKPQISYYNIGSKSLKYASRSGGTWTKETVDAIYRNTVGQSTSLSFWEDGDPVISYRYVTGNDLRVARGNPSLDAPMTEDDPLEVAPEE